MQKGVLERINESILSWFGHVIRMKDNRLVKQMYKSECAGNRLPGRPKDTWLKLVSACVLERGLSLKQASRLANERDDWRGFVRGHGRQLGSGMTSELSTHDNPAQCGSV